MNIVVLLISSLWIVCDAYNGLDVVPTKAGGDEQDRTMIPFNTIRKRRLVNHSDIDVVPADGSNNDSVLVYSNESDVEAKRYRYHVADLDFANVSTPFVVSLWIVFASIAKIAFHVKNVLSSVFPESCLLIVIGVLLGLILFVTGQTDYHLDARMFFLILLPPIILDAGYFMPTRAFFENIGTILLFAVVGTIWNALAIGLTLWGLGCAGLFEMIPPMHVLVFASVMAAVDPVAVLAVFEQVHVNELLHIVVLGESLLNDGIAVVLYRMFEGFIKIGSGNILYSDVAACLASFIIILVGSPLIGIAYGFAGGLMSRFTHRVRVIEPLIVFVFGYLSYLTAEMFHLSGILSCICSAITMKRYVEANLSLKSHTTVKYFMKMLASVCDSIVFMYLGISVVIDSHVWDTAFVLSTLFACLVYRTIGVVLISMLANHRRVVKLSYVDQFVMSYGGLRGAIAFALVVLLHEDHVPERHKFITTAIFIIYFTNLVQGTTIKPLVQYLKVKHDNKHKPSMNEKVANRFLDYLMAGIEDITGHRGHHLLRERFLSLNNKYIKPLMFRKKNVRRHRGWSLVDVCKQLNERDARDLLLGSSSLISLNEGALTASSSLARVFSSSSLRFYLGNSAWRRTSSDSGLHVVPSLTGLPEVGSSTCLDLQALDVQETRKMKDDSKIHHIDDDFLCKTRKKFVYRRHVTPHPITTDGATVFSEAELPYHRNEPMHLRHMLSHTQWLLSAAAHGNRAINASVRDKAIAFDAGKVSAHNGINANYVTLKPNKSVSFARVENVLNEASDPDLEVSSVHVHIGDHYTAKNDDDDDEEDDNGIVFTVPPRVNTNNVAAGCPDNDTQDIADDFAPTAAEVSLPWKRNTGRKPMSSVETHTMPDDSCPVLSEVPLWVSDTTENSTLSINMECSMHYDADDTKFIKSEAAVYSGEEDSINSADDADNNTVQEVNGKCPRVTWPASGSCGEVAAEFSDYNSDTIPPPWRTTKRNSESQLNRSLEDEWLVNRPDSHYSSRLDRNKDELDAKQISESYCPFPWRDFSGNDRVIPDQHAPRPVLSSSHVTENGGSEMICCSPSQSFVDGISMHPQASCQSFRLSEAESKHSEPFHLHHVIDLTPPAASHWLPSSFAPETDSESTDVLINLEQADSKQRIFQWLEALEEEFAMPDFAEANELSDYS